MKKIGQYIIAGGDGHSPYGPFPFSRRTLEVGALVPPSLGMDKDVRVLVVIDPDSAAGKLVSHLLRCDKVGGGDGFADALNKLVTEILSSSQKSQVKT
jgi:hypothetical protein